jgi:uncharacterized protein YhaN
LILKKIYIKNFKGIKEREIELSRKLNIFYGPNEAGKSSVLEAITNGFFVSAQSTRSDLRNTWHLFAHPPLIEISFELNGKDCLIKKDFSSREEFFEDESSSKTTGKKEIEKAIRRIFGFGESVTVDEILKFFTNTFIFRQEQLKLENDAMIDKLLQIFFESHIKGAEVSPEKAAKVLEKYLKDRFSKGEKQAAKRPGLTRKLEDEIKELEERKRELDRKFEEARENTEQLNEFTRRLEEVKKQIDDGEKRKRSLESLLARIEKLDQAQAEMQFYENILRKMQIEKEIEASLSSSASALSALEEMSSQFKAVFEMIKRLETKIEQAIKEMKEIEIYETKKDELKRMPALDDALPDRLRNLNEILDFEKDIMKIESELKGLPELRRDELEDVRYAALIAKENIGKTEGAMLEITLKSDFAPEIIADGRRIDIKGKEHKGVFQKELAVSGRDFDISITLTGDQKAAVASEKLNRTRDIMQKYGITDINLLLKASEKAERLNSQKTAKIDQLLKKSDYLADGLEKLIQENRLKEFFAAVEKEIKKILAEAGVSDLKELQEKIEKRKRLQYEIFHYQEKFTDDYIAQKKSFLKISKGILEQLKPDLPYMLKSYEEGRRLLDEAMILLKKAPVKIDTNKELYAQIADVENAVSELIKMLSTSEYDKESFVLSAKKVFGSESVAEMFYLIVRKKEEFVFLLNEFVQKAREVRKTADEHLRNKDELIEVTGTLKSIEHRFPELKYPSDLNAEEVASQIKGTKKKIASLTVTIDYIADSIEDFDFDLHASPGGAAERLEQELKKINAQLDSSKNDSFELKNKISYLSGRLEDIPSFDELLNLLDELERKNKAYENARIRKESLRIATMAIRNAAQRYHEKILEKIRDSASSVFSAITDGKYSLELSFSEDGSRGHIKVVPQESEHEFLLEHLSQGTADQVFTALRLGFVHAYFENQSFPIFFDDSFSDFDEARLRNTADYLTNLLKNLDSAQLFLFTCHNHIAELFKDFAEEKSIEYKFHRLDYDLN